MKTSPRDNLRAYMRQKSEREKLLDSMRAPSPIYNLTKPEKIVIKKTINEDLKEQLGTPPKEE